MGETFHIAKNSGDAKFLQWIHDRLLHVHGENADIDYMHTLRAFVKYFASEPDAVAVERAEAVEEAITDLVCAVYDRENGPLSRCVIAQNEVEKAKDALVQLFAKARSQP